ncbi:MAG: 4-alpha-glucanotransferase [Chlamydiales bacterium 38-26]|nr:4-alpha-glucanotransferase [Chlamydiales bacterium]OJV09246.1 MAG: 4-alpha-glucanotransferase [Chlamydiales bacterium 38-26]
MNMIPPLTQDLLLSSISAPAWKHIGVKHHHGINLPLFSLRTLNSGGIGEFFDLKHVIDWCHKIGYDVLQILPINDTGPEPSPYSAISAFALNPLHISLHALPGLDQYDDLQVLLADLQELNYTQRLNYPLLHKKRDVFLHLYYQYTYPKESHSEDYIQFVKHNDWVHAFALFKTLKIIRDWQPWSQWPQELKDPSPAELEQLQNEYSTQVSYHIFLQYLCFKQFAEVKKYAKVKKVFLKGDIPILISRESVDVWSNRNLFVLAFSAGAPPDMYSLEGQNWEFPIYNWAEMEKKHYLWWKLRLSVASHLYDIFRIDHVVGFFRIWAIPPGKKGVEGHYIPEDERCWIDHGKKNLLLMLQGCHMLPIGEDLGTVPPEVRECLKKLGICGTKVMRWERYWEGDKSYIPIQDYPSESMTTVSTHDSETLHQWWQNEPIEAQEYAQSKGWDYAPQLSPEQNISILKDSHRSNSIFHINLLNEYLHLIPAMTWPLLEDERINDPSSKDNKNWTYRFRMNFEEIAQNTQLEHLMKSFVK